MHVTLWASQKYVFGPNGTMDFETQVGADNDNIALKYSQDVANRLERLGYRNVRKYREGIQDWTDAGLPVESGVLSA